MAACSAEPSTLKEVDFTAAGPTAGSPAAGLMSSVATANGGEDVAAGLLFSAAQSAAIGGAAMVGVGAAMVGVEAVVAAVPVVVAAVPAVVAAVPAVVAAMPAGVAAMPAAVAALPAAMAAVSAALVAGPPAVFGAPAALAVGVVAGAAAALFRRWRRQSKSV